MIVTKLNIWFELCRQLCEFYKIQPDHMRTRMIAGRLKQWISLLIRHFPPASSLFQSIKREADPRTIVDAITLSKLALQQ